MLEAYLAFSLLALVVVGFIGWMIRDEVRERRRARALAHVIGQFQRDDHYREGGWR